jgi:predicted transcriptional regulator
VTAHKSEEEPEDEEPLVLVEAAELVELVELEAAELVVADLEPVVAVEELAELVEPEVAAGLAVVEVLEPLALVAASEDVAAASVGAWVLWWWDLQLDLVLTRESGATLAKALLTVTCSPSADVKRNDKGISNPLIEREAECQYPQAALWDISDQFEDPASCISTFTVDSSSSLGSTASQ